MDADNSGLWCIMVIVTGSVGPGILLYGIRRKESLPLLFGTLIGIIPMFCNSGVMATIWFLVLLLAFLGLRKL